MSTLRDDLFRLLPRVYQQRDAASEQGNGALGALLAVLGTQGDVIAADLARLYDDWFIETCAEWVVPYLGDLLGVRLLHPVGPGAGRARALVGNTLTYRRGKGTVAALEQLAYDVTGWPAAAVEYFTRLGTTQHLKHPRLLNVRTPDLRHQADLELLGGPFSKATHTAEVRRMPRGRYGIPNIGLHVWRLATQRVPRATARPVTDPPDGRYHIDPVGLDVPLFNPGTTETDVGTLAQEHNVPQPLRRRALYDELEALRADSESALRWFGSNPVIEVFADLGAGLYQVPAPAMTVADLADRADALAGGWPRPAAAPLVVAVDPVLGRLAFRTGLAPARVEVTATYATPGQVGAGPYDRSLSATADLFKRASWLRAVGRYAAATPDLVHTSITAAVDDWNTAPAGTVGVIAVLDNATYREELTGTHAISVPPGSELLIIATTWPQAEKGDGPLSLDQASPADRRPHLLGSAEVVGRPGEQDSVAGQLIIDGVLIEGSVRVRPGDLGLLGMRHVTVVPARGGLSVDAPSSAADDNGRLVVDLERSIVGPVELPARGPRVTVRSSILDGAGAHAVDAAHAPVSFDRVSALGAVFAETLDASDCVLDGPVTVQRRQTGCLRFSYLSEEVAAPRRYRCQPDLAVGDETDPSRLAAIRARLTPVFTSTTFGDPAYGRLDDRCEPALLNGASNGAAMGAFADLEEPQRMANLAAVLEEYLRLGLEAGVIHET